MRIKNISNKVVSVDVNGLNFNLSPGELTPKVLDMYAEEAIKTVKILYPDLKLILGDEEEHNISKPTGFVDSSLVTLSIDDSTRTLSISVSEETYCWVDGMMIPVLNQSVEWSDVYGQHVFYIDELGRLLTSESFVEDFILKYTLVSILYWDQANGKHIYWANEKHGIEMSNKTHQYLHLTRGASFDRGCLLTGFSVDQNGSLDSHCQFSAESGVIWDEDIRIALGESSQFPVLYRSGSTWFRKEADNFPVIYNGTAGYTGSTIAYNYFNGTSWSLQPVNGNKFVLIHVFATNDFEFPYMCVLGTQEYLSKTAARDAASLEIKNISGLPFAEFCPVGTVIFQTNSSYLNTAKCLVVSINSEEYKDWRGEQLRIGSLAR